MYELGPGRQLSTKEDEATRIDYTLQTGETCSVSFLKGRNRNILVSVTNTQVAQELCKLDQPFSVYSPGLAGISKREGYISDGVLFRALSRGDANLVLRNILLRLWPEDDEQQQGKWDEFLSDLRQIFPDLDLSVAFNEALDESIEVSLTTDGKHWVPLEIAGTGVLQAMQILSYIHRFEPTLVVLDEPDSHLHPNNQRLLCSLLREVAGKRGTQILLTTHSRHVLDAVGGSGNILWVRQGGVETADQDDQVGVLLDIGALDIRERVGSPSTTAVILTEDEITNNLSYVAKASGFDLDHTVIQSYFGVTDPHNLRPLVSMIRKIHPKAVIVVHRDRDFMNDSEVSDWEASIVATKATPFVTYRRDIESHLLSPEHLSAANPGTSAADFESLIDEVAKLQMQETVSAYINGRAEISRKAKTFGTLNLGELGVKAGQIVSSNPHLFIGKTTLKHLRKVFKERTGKNLATRVETPFLSYDNLRQAAKRVKK